MAIVELFSLRQKKIRGELLDVYQYEELPYQLRVQIIHIIKDTVGDNKSSNSKKIYQNIHEILCREYGVFSLSDDQYKSDAEALYEYFLKSDNVEECLDIIELTFKYIEFGIKPKQAEFSYGNRTKQEADDAIEELNYRLKSAGVGYEYVSGKIIKIDSQFIHSEIVKPALMILQSDQIYNGAKDEFISAHTHYRNQQYKEALVDCLKSFESMMKAICKKRGWQFDENYTAKKLINICLTNNLIPLYMQEQFSQFRALLESGVPTVRNKEGGHGQGLEIKNVSVSLTSYTLHLTATNIVFLGECEKES